MGIVDEDIAKVRAATDFVAVAGEHLALRRVGTRWVGLCPFHNEKSPSFSVNAELGLYYCFGCGAKGDAITFVREIEHLDFAEAVEKLAARAGISLRYEDRGGGRDQARRARIHETLDGAIAWYHERLLSGPDAAAARAYLRRDRGYDGDLVRRYRLGWAPGGRDELIRSLGVPAGALVDAGLASVDDSGRYSDFFRARLLFPIFEAGGRPVGAGGRVLPGGTGPKYKNTPGTPVYDKSRVLYGLNWAKKAVVDSGRVVVCEGYTDVIALQSAGIGEAVATCGTSLADGHVRLLTNFARRLVLAYDADAAGQAAAERFYDWERRFDVDIRVAAMPAGADPADLARSDPSALVAAVEGARPYLAFRLDRLLARSDLSGPEGRARAAALATAMVSEHPNPLVRDQYLMDVADRCRVEPERLRAMMKAGPPGSGAPDGDFHRIHTSTRPPDAQDQPAPDQPAPVVLPGPEREALRLAVHRPADMADRLELVLFAHPVARSAFTALAGTTTLHDAIESADPQTADLLQRLAVEETAADPDDVVVLLAQRAGMRLVRELEAEMRQAPASAHGEYAQTIGWVVQCLQAMRSEDEDVDAAVAAQRRLVVWMAAREDAAALKDPVARNDAEEPDTEATHE